MLVGIELTTSKLLRNLSSSQMKSKITLRVRFLILCTCSFRVNLWLLSLVSLTESPSGNSSLVTRLSSHLAHSQEHSVTMIPSLLKLVLKLSMVRLTTSIHLDTVVSKNKKTYAPALISKPKYFFMPVHGGYFHAKSVADLP